MVAHKHTYAWIQIVHNGYSRSSLARSDTASTSSVIRTRLCCIEQPREDLLSAITLNIVGANWWNALSIRYYNAKKKPNDAREKCAHIILKKENINV